MGQQAALMTAKEYRGEIVGTRKYSEGEKDGKSRQGVPKRLRRIGCVEYVWFQ